MRTRGWPATRRNSSSIPREIGSVRSEEGRPMSSGNPATQTDSRVPEVGGRRFDPLDPVQAGDPYPWLRAAQLDQPVFYLPERDVWCVTRYADVMEVLRDTTTYSSRKVIRFVQLGPE